MYNFELGDDLYCIKSFGKLTKGNSYRISGYGDLNMVDSNKGGLGYNIQHYCYINNRSIYTNYYLTLSEMQEHFIPYDIYYKSILREFKIDMILDKKNKL